MIAGAFATWRTPSRIIRRHKSLIQTRFAFDSFVIWPKISRFQSERIALPLQTRANPLDVAVESGVIPVERPGVWDERSFLVRGESMSWLEQR